ncbi:dCTP deaminase [Kitasatospora sp. NPDC059327]|uniref:dCTP deaminase n=1 Tax=Kitasatospora sp. NPDC059327 TaxID=3346803 RepID=UPI0036CA19D1
MILTGPEIVRERDAGRLTIEPFDPAQVNPNSYNLTLGPTILVYTGAVLDTRRQNDFVMLDIPEEGIVLDPGRIYLGASVEVIGSDHYVPIMHSRSGSARLGVFSHVTADLIDQGSHGQLTHQLRVVQPVTVYAGISLAQVDFRRTQGEPMLYDGKYQGSRGPQASQIHLDPHHLGTAA